ncbi:MAG: bifunctional 2-polyprenyl-6-hydroxyphenol methylase/3-demethylubiquinol 3-O-methyltransferase UbiG [Anaerolineae bacterium]
MSAFNNNVDHDEINKFDKVSQIWWDPQGEMRTLQTINPLRTKFIMEPLTGIPRPKILDVGCGGGVLSEALARAGAEVTGIDLAQAALEVARHHAQGQGLQIEYRLQSAEEIAQQQPANFDAVVCMEMLEHVPEPNKVIEACAQALKPGGHAFFSTINRTPKSFLFVIIGGEYILRLLPKGTHTYSKLIRPNELKAWANSAGLEFQQIASLIYNPFTGKFKLVENRVDDNYLMHFIKK